MVRGCHLQQWSKNWPIYKAEYEVANITQHLVNLIHNHIHKILKISKEKNSSTNVYLEYTHHVYKGII